MLTRPDPARLFGRTSRPAVTWPSSRLPRTGSTPQPPGRSSTSRRQTKEGEEISSTGWRIRIRGETAETTGDDPVPVQESGPTRRLSGCSRDGGRGDGPSESGDGPRGLAAPGDIGGMDTPPCRSRISRRRRSAGRSKHRAEVSLEGVASFELTATARGSRHGLTTADGWTVVNHAWPLVDDPGGRHRQSQPVHAAKRRADSLGCKPS